MFKRFTAIIIFALLIAGNLVAQIPQRENGGVLLPNGWRLTPVGRYIGLGDLPLNAAVTLDQKYLAVTHAGMSSPKLMVVDLKKMRVVQSIPMKDSWYGIRFYLNQLFVSGGNENCVYIFKIENGGILVPEDTIVFEMPSPKYFGWVAGLDVHKNILAVVMRGDSTLRYCNLISGNKEKVKLDGMPYDCKFAPDGSLLVSLWDSKKVEVYRGDKELYKVITGTHPNEIEISSDGKTAMVADANDNTVTFIDLKKRKVQAKVVTALYPDAPQGSTTNSVCFAGKYALAANADNNSLTVIDISNSSRPIPVGMIPVGWYPTKVIYLKNGTILVLNGKGNQSYANPEHTFGSDRGYIGTLLKGTLSYFKFPNRSLLSKYTRRVYQNTPFNPHEMSAARFEGDSPIPSRVGGSSPIKYIFYFIKENRTYDQVLGDVKEGNGDSSLCLFGEEVTPNTHKLAKTFVLLDNLYCDAEVSADGHNWSTAAYATDFVEKSWPNNYGRRGAPYDFEGGMPAASPDSGYIWDLCARHGVSYRSYGEFIQSSRKIGEPGTAREKSLLGHYDPMYRGWDLKYSDVDRFEEWNREFTKYEKDGGLPKFSIIRLPNDHTAGTAKGYPTPQAMVAENDYALGLFVDRISKSKFWKQSAIFVIEDDAQDGADHVDAHRTVGLVISPYVKRHFVDHTFYTTSSMLRTIELILGLPPMSQYDAAANVMFNSFTINPDTSSYTVVQPKININARNPIGSYGQLLIEHMDLNHADRVPDRLFNEIIWKSIKKTEMPVPRYSVFSTGD